MSEKHPAIIRLLAATLLISTTIACGGGGGGSIALDDLSDEVANSICADAVQCGVFPSEAACKDSINIDQGQVSADVEAGLVEYNGDKARECLNGLNPFSCTLQGGEGSEPAACDETFVGSIALGGDCYSSEACAGDATCDGEESDPCTPGTCVAEAPPPGLGDSCADGFCADGLRCAEQVCEALAAAGAQCQGIFSCVDGYICEPGPDQTPGTCVVLADTGGSCNPDIGSSFFHACLQRSDFCDAADSTCKPRLATGASCAGDALSSACVRYADCIEGVCVADLLVGEPCVIDSAGAQCLNGLDCSGGVCTVEPPDMVCSL